jgi:hypothetical protein
MGRAASYTEEKKHSFLLANLEVVLHVYDLELSVRQVKREDRK